MLASGNVLDINQQPLRTDGFFNCRVAESSAAMPNMVDSPVKLQCNKMDFKKWVVVFALQMYEYIHKYDNCIIICVYIMYTWLFWSMLQYHPVSHLSKIPSKMGRSAGCNLTSTPCRVNVSPQHRPGQTHRSRRCGSWAQTWLGALGYRRRYTVV